MPEQEIPAPQTQDDEALEADKLALTEAGIVHSGWSDSHIHQKARELEIAPWGP